MPFMLVYTWLLQYNGFPSKRIHVDVSVAEALVHGPILIKLFI